MNALLKLSTVELKLLVRNKTVAVTAIALPLMFGAFLVANRDATAMHGGWPAVVALQFVSLLGFTVYVSVTTTLAARRQDLYLKRLRSGEVSDGAILGGMMVPFAVLGVAQAVVILIYISVNGAPVPADPVALVLALIVGVAVSMAVGVVTSAVTATAEMAQITTAPFFFALLGGAIWALTNPGDVLPLIAPGGAVTDLVSRAWDDGGIAAHLGDALPALGISAVWVIVSVVAAGRLFRWEPRG
ncbi:ABC-2 type transport system permease protein [Herbihabitans rhizosphaerae]|uniref:ABC-2 type transport system permease protein n=1 Tax=Herbihabitans rhizosphaerae TaxID=1872711 RepID=A0A4Q7L1H5_9PSEU|nr:ABC transporter permease [Herbihabitans rhizosphaerae]RZS43378.1 ABC-2 type transport system permease protein [Herbihabitans rhizosphaerae]